MALRHICRYCSRSIAARCITNDLSTLGTNASKRRQYSLNSTPLGQRTDPDTSENPSTLTPASSSSQFITKKTPEALFAQIVGKEHLANQTPTRKDSTVRAHPKTPTKRSPSVGQPRVAPSSQDVELMRLRKEYKGNEFNPARLADIQSRLTKALNLNDRKWATAIWEEIAKYKVGVPNNADFSTAKLATAKQGPNYKEVPIELYHRLLTVFSKLQLRDRTVEIWDDMIRAGHKPTQILWHAQLDVCRLTWNAEALEQTWQSMIEDGIKPDLISWSTRIRGLMVCGKFDEAMAAFGDMGNIWKLALRRKLGLAPDAPLTLDMCSQCDTIDDTVKPNTHTINSLLSTLVSTKRRDLIPLVLDFAKRLGISNNVITYNIYLKSLANQNSAEAVRGLLHEMDVNGIPPDGHTYGILLHYALENPRAFGQATGLQAASAVLDLMTHSSLEASVESYGAIVHHILDMPEPDLQVIEAILENMREQGVQLSSNICTGLAKYHLQKEKPDFIAFDKLWTEMARHGVRIDNVFFDRVIIACAQTDDAGRAWTFLTRMIKEGKIPGWPALTAVGVALARANDISRLKGFVEGVIDEEKTNEDLRRTRGSTGLPQFVRFVHRCEKHGILDGLPDWSFLTAGLPRGYLS
jgi:pentatricopeptide repeat protein